MSGTVRLLSAHEWRVLSRSVVLQASLAVLVVSLAVAAVLGLARASAERRLADTFTARAEAARTTPVSLSADVVANQKGWLALVPPAPLAALAVGQSDVHPSYLTVTARRLDALVSGDQVEHPQGVAAGPFDVAFVVLFLYPLLIFAIGFDLTASERDRGTLRMVLAHPIRLRDLVVAKMITRAVLLAVPVAFIPVLAAGEFGWRLAIWTTAVLGYGSIWHGLALVVNARGWPAATNALVLAGLWLVLVVVGPSAINLAIDAFAPMPSRVEAAVQARAATQDATVQGSRALGQFLEDHPTSANVGRDGLRQFALLQAARDRQVAERLEAVEAAFATQRHRQRRIAAWAGVLSPAMIAQGVLLDAAGTGTRRFAHFRGEAEAFQRAWQDYFEPRVLDAATLTPEEMAAAPVFRYVEEPASRMAARAAPAVTALWVAGALLLWWGFKTYRGYAL